MSASNSLSQYKQIDENTILKQSVEQFALKIRNLQVYQDQSMDWVKKQVDLVVKGFEKQIKNVKLKNHHRFLTNLANVEAMLLAANEYKNAECKINKLSKLFRNVTFLV